MNSGRIYYAGQKQPSAEITNGALVWLREPEDEVEDTAVRRAFAMWQIGKMKDRKPKKYTPPPGDPEDAASPPPAPKMTASDGVKTPEYKLWVKKYHPEMYFDLYRERP